MESVMLDIQYNLPENSGETYIITDKIVAGLTDEDFTPTKPENKEAA
jgi:hypothetical protein